MKRPAGRPVRRLLRSRQETMLASTEVEAVQRAAAEGFKMHFRVKTSRTCQRSKTGRVRKMKRSRIIPRLADKRTAWIIVTFTGMENN